MLLETKDTLLIMAKTTGVQLGDHFDAFIAEKLETGRYRNAGELIREGLRRIEIDEKNWMFCRKSWKLAVDMQREVSLSIISLMNLLWLD